MPAPHIPALRLGRPYASADRAPVPDYRSGEALAWISQVNSALIRRDLFRPDGEAAGGRALPAADLLETARRAGELFARETLPLGEETQSPDTFITQVSASTGLPCPLVRRHVRRIAELCAHLPEVLRGLIREDDLSLLDGGWVKHNGAVRAFAPQTPALGVVMPSNSPGVNTLWLPAIVMKVAVALKPGRDDPWTPYRLFQALLASGLPADALSYYPTDHEGAMAILRSAGRSLLFGDDETTAPWRGDSRVEIHGPGRSKVLIGEDLLDAAGTLEVCISSILENSGRSCTNASTIVVPRRGAEIAEALAARLATVEPRPPEDEEAKLAAFVRLEIAERIDAAIEQGLRGGGAVDVTGAVRGGGRLVRAHGGTYLLPTIIRCDSLAHPLANREFLFPFASVVEIPEMEMAEAIGPSLVVTALTRNETVIRRLLAAPHIGRLHIGPIPTWQVAWDQPHEGNLFELLYRRRALQVGEISAPVPGRS